MDGLRVQKQLAVGDEGRAAAAASWPTSATLLGEAWQQKKTDVAADRDPFIDEAYEVAIRHGAIGGKVTGAGGGGYMLFYCHFDTRHLVAEALIKMGLTVNEFGFDSAGLTTWRVSG